MLCNLIVANASGKTIAEAQNLDIQRACDQIPGWMQQGLSVTLHAIVENDQPMKKLFALFALFGLSILLLGCSTAPPTKESQEYKDYLKHAEEEIKACQDKELESRFETGKAHN